MSPSRRLLPSFTPTSLSKLAPIAIAMVAMLAGPDAYAASFGHSRILSKPGKPLAIDVPVLQLDDQDVATLTLAAAPVAAWKQAGLTPPVDLGSLSVRLADGIAQGKRVIQVRSTQAFSGSVADLLLDVGTASGQQRYQVSLLANPGAPAVPLAQSAGSGSGATSPGSAVAGQPAQASIRVNRGDTMFSIARRHAVEGVTVYQMMIALQRANPQAFIHNNLNMVKAGATLAMPDAAALTAISDHEARRLFQQQAQAYANYRRGAAASADIMTGLDSASQGVVTHGGTTGADGALAAKGDQLRLSDSKSGGAGAAGRSGVAGTSTTGSLLPGASAATADDRLATSKDIADASGRVSQLESNVQNLNRALQSQGEAAKELVLEGAKGLGQSLSDMASAVTVATGSGDTGVSSDAAASANTEGVSPPSSASTGSASDRTNNVTEPVTQKAKLTVSWLQENMLAVISGILVFIVLLLAWLLRRASAKRNDGSAVSPAMVKKKLDEINLDLNQAATDSSPPSKT
ncbi:MAG: hypothetical protein KA735_05060 [Burkholderiaceae bacterium]|nr:hypothetical protein [Burkholderiaceae bacterium]